MHVLKTIICNKCEQSNVRGDILNAGDNVDNFKKIGFTESYFNIAPTNIDDYTKNKLLFMQQDNLIPKRNIEINYKRTDERYQKNMIEKNESDERDQISKNMKKKYLKIEKSWNWKFWFLDYLYISWGKIWQNLFKCYAQQHGLWQKRTYK